MLQKILEYKIDELNRTKSERPLDAWKDTLVLSTRDFKAAISKKGDLPNLIAEIKKASPSAGVIRKDFDPISIAKVYEKYAAAISVITDEHFFQGKLDYLRKVSEVTTLPLLRKDFIFSEYQIYESRLYNADAILLIAHFLSSEQIEQYIKLAHSLHMDVLVEIHDWKDLEKALETAADIIGINNRNLEDFSTDVQTTLDLVFGIPDGKIIVSESGFQTKKDIMKVQGHATAVLIGTSLMKSDDVEIQIRSLF